LLFGGLAVTGLPFGGFHMTPRVVRLGASTETETGSETRSRTENKRIGCFKAIALPAKDQTTPLEPVQGTAGSFWSEQRSKRFLTRLSSQKRYLTPLSIAYCRCRTSFTRDLEDVSYLAGYNSPRTTRPYDRQQKKVTRNIVERILI